MGAFAGSQVKRLHSLDLNQLQFVGEALTTLRREVDGKVIHSTPFWSAGLATRSGEASLMGRPGTPHVLHCHSMPVQLA